MCVWMCCGRRGGVVGMLQAGASTGAGIKENKTRCSIVFQSQFTGCFPTINTSKEKLLCSQCERVVVC